MSWFSELFPKPPKDPICLRQVFSEYATCSYCGVTMVAVRSKDGCGWRYFHGNLPTGTTIGCVNAGKIYRVPLTTLEEAEP
jgi:hypothetical protein